MIVCLFINIKFFSIFIYIYSTYNLYIWFIFFYNFSNILGKVYYISVKDFVTFFDMIKLSFFVESQYVF